MGKPELRARDLCGEALKGGDTFVVDRWDIDQIDRADIAQCQVRRQAYAAACSDGFTILRDRLADKTRCVAIDLAANVIVCDLEGVQNTADAVGIYARYQNNCDVKVLSCSVIDCQKSPQRCHFRHEQQMCRFLTVEAIHAIRKPSGACCPLL